jgi:hypothetical protein
MFDSRPFRHPTLCRSIASDRHSIGLDSSSCTRPSPSSIVAYSSSAIQLSPVPLETSAAEASGCGSTGEEPPLGFHATNSSILISAPTAFDLPHFPKRNI